MRDLLRINPGWGITLVRVMMGLLFAIHGYEKFTRGLGTVASGFSKMSIPAPQVVAPFIAGLELVGGVCLILGLLTRVFGLLFACEMIVTTIWVQIPTRGWNGSDLDRMLLVSAFLMVFAGPGLLAIDQFWFEHPRTEQRAGTRRGPAA